MTPTKLRHPAFLIPMVLIACRGLVRSFPPGGARRGHVRNCCFLGAFPPAGGRSWHARNNGVYCMRDRMAREEAVESLV